MNDFLRDLKEKIASYLEDKSKNKSVLILSGARQTGKTTLLKNILKNKKHLFLDLEQQRSYAALIDKFNDFSEFEIWLADEFGFSPKEKILCIDEAQYSKGLGKFVGAMKDNWENATTIITGSLVSELYDETTRRPVGRETYLELWPLSFKEFLQACGFSGLVDKINSFSLGEELSDAFHERFLKAYDEYLKVGGLPEIVKLYLEKKEFIRHRRDIFRTYEDDFVRYYQKEDTSLFSRCLAAVAQNVGSPSKDSQAVRPNVTGYKKVAGIYSRLEKWNLIIKYEQLGMRPEHNKFYPKRYLYDIGVLRDIRLKGLEGLHIQDLSNEHLRAPLGGIIENALALSLKKQFSDDVFGVQLSGQSEIDFAVKINEHVYPVESKMSLRFKKNYLRGISAYLNKMTKNSTGFLFYGGKPVKEKIESCYIVPYYLSDCLERWVDGF